MQAGQEQLSAAAKTTAVVFLVTAVIASYRIIQYTWIAKLNESGTTLGAKFSPFLSLPIPLTAESLQIPTASPIPQPQPAAVTAPPDTPRFTIQENTIWREYTGDTYTYIFSIPETLVLMPLPGNGPDTYGMSWGAPPTVSILIGVTDLSKDPKTNHAVAEPKRVYVENWWKQFSGFMGASPVSEFTNTQGLKGYKTRYILNSGASTGDNVFFEVPNHPEFIIRVTNAFIDQAVFDRIVDSVGWRAPTPTATPAAATPTPLSPTSTPIPTNSPTTTPSNTPNPTNTPTPSVSPGQ